MARRTPAEVYADLVAAGFPAAAATVMTAIAGAESGYDDTARGDVGLQTSVWGPSFGLFQIRTVKRETGSGSDRDISALAASDARQAQAALRISRGGVDFTPWTVFRTGAYRRYLPQAQAAAGGVVPAGLPLPGLGGADVLGGVRTIVIQAAFVGLGLALVVAGLVRAGTARPLVRELRAEARAGARLVGAG